MFTNTASLWSFILEGPRETKLSIPELHHWQITHGNITWLNIAVLIIPHKSYLKTAAQKTCSVYLFVTENTSLFKFSRSNARNDALKASLDTVKLHWNCMILPSGCSDLESPEGSISPLWILKVMAVSPPLSLSLSLATEKKNMSSWPTENIVFHLWASIAHFQCCPWKCIERQPTAWQNIQHTLVDALGASQYADQR